MLLLATIRQDDLKTSITCRVLDLSSDGIRASMASPLRRGQPVKIGMKGVGDICGKVAWCRKGVIGVKFDTKIDTNAIIQALTGAPAATHIEFAKGPVPRPGFHVR